MVEYSRGCVRSSPSLHNAQLHKASQTMLTENESTDNQLYTTFCTAFQFSLHHMAERRPSDYSTKGIAGLAYLPQSLQIAYRAASRGPSGTHSSTSSPGQSTVRLTLSIARPCMFLCMCRNIRQRCRSTDRDPDINPIYLQTKHSPSLARRKSRVEYEPRFFSRHMRAQLRLWRC